MDLPPEAVTPQSERSRSAATIPVAGTCSGDGTQAMPSAWQRLCVCASNPPTGQTSEPEPKLEPEMEPELEPDPEVEPELRHPEQTSSLTLRALASSDDLPKGLDREDIAALRSFVLSCQAAMSSASDMIDKLQGRAQSSSSGSLRSTSSRKGFLQSVHDQIGMPSANKDTRATVVHELRGLITPGSPQAALGDGVWAGLTGEGLNREYDSTRIRNAIIPWLLGERREGVHQGNHTLDAGGDAHTVYAGIAHGTEAAGWMGKQTESLIENGWPEFDAQMYSILGWIPLRRAIANGLRTRDSGLVGSTYALCEALYRVARQQATGPAPPRLYRHLSGRFSLAEDDERWLTIETPDLAGFRGFTSPALTRATCDPRCFHADGFAQYMHTSKENEPQDSDVVCFESIATMDGDDMHAAIMTEKTQEFGVFPPNTLFRLKSVEEDGFIAPGGQRVRQRLLVVTATYRPPRAQQSEDGKQNGSKLCGTVVTLSYADRGAYVTGLDDILARPVLNMSNELGERTMEWTDFRGQTYSLKSEWAYVNERVPSSAEGDHSGRDDGNVGKSPDDFLREVNGFIQARREDGFGLNLSIEHAMLTLDEVLSVRVYSGPTYQPINGFLRQIGRLTGIHREAMARNPVLTFTATIGHLCSAIRKLAAVATPDEVSAPLFRGVRGELPRSFWLPDDKGMVCATDCAFMSTSRSRTVPIEFMSGNENVLWELAPKAESDAGFHYGADISLLSQFSGEEEVLFPPCTMMVLLPGVGEAQGAPSERNEDGTKAFVSVKVQPYFV